MRAGLRRITGLDNRAMSCPIGDSSILLSDKESAGTPAAELVEDADGTPVDSLCDPLPDNINKEISNPVNHG